MRAQRQTVELFADLVDAKARADARIDRILAAAPVGTTRDDVARALGYGGNNMARALAMLQKGTLPATPAALSANEKKRRIRDLHALVPQATYDAVRAALEAAGQDVNRALDALTTPRAPVLEKREALRQLRELAPYATEADARDALAQTDDDVARAFDVLDAQVAHTDADVARAVQERFVWHAFDAHSVKPRPMLDADDALNCQRCGVVRDRHGRRVMRRAEVLFHPCECLTLCTNCLAYWLASPDAAQCAACGEPYTSYELVQQPEDKDTVYKDALEED